MDSRASFFVLVLTSSILHMTSGQDLNGCGVTKGCFKQPPTCTGNDCTAYVTWETTQDGQTRFSMRAERSAGLGWVAIGLRPAATTSGMSPADVYACTSDSEVRRSENVASPLNSAARTIPSNAVTTGSIASVNNVINCVFTRQANVVGDATFYDISGDNEYYILLAVGSRINPDGSIEGNRHSARFAADQAVKLQGGFSVPTGAPTTPQAINTSPPGQSVPTTEPQPISTGSPGQVLNGCGITKGCFKQPPTCTGNDCTAYVTWETTQDGQTRFSMRAERSAGLGWVAVGLRPAATTSGMSPADVYACTSNNEVRRSENVAGPLNSASRTIPSGTVTTESATFQNNVISCVFTRQASLAGDTTFYDISGDNQYFILMAYGTNINSDGSIAGNRHSDRFAADQAVKLQGGFSVPTGAPTTPQAINTGPPGQSVPTTEPQPISTGSPGQVLNGCGVTKGCFKQPPTCTGNDCTAYVTWETTQDGQTRFSMRAETAGLDWVAVGLRPAATTSGMSPADVYACTSNSEVRRSENVAYNSESRTIPNNAVTTESVTFVNNVISCVFTRQANVAGDATFYDISGDNQYYILLAIGNNINGDGTIAGNQHSDRFAVDQPVKLQGDFSVPTGAPTTPQPINTGPPGQELEGCGVSIGCFRQPPDCSVNDCTAYVTWQIIQADGLTQFAMRAQATGWVAIGLRPSNVTGGMSPADVYACTSNNEVRRSENVSPLNSASRTIPSGTVTTESATFENNVISCVFTRQASLAGDTTFYDISGDNRYFILMAYGDRIGADRSIAGNQHADRWAATEAQKLSEFVSIVTESATLAKFHACLMVIAWVGFASIGITMARFFKPMWPTSTLLGQKVWFTIHRMCMMTCVLCFCVAFILIFVYVNGFVEVGEPLAFAHGICGIIVTCLGLINPIMAIFRPHPGTPKRPIFNWAHWSVGTSAHLLALVTVLLGIGYPSSILSGLANYAFFVMIAFVLFHILIWILFEVQRCMAESPGSEYAQSNNPQASRSNDIAMKASGNSSEQLASPDPASPPDRPRKNTSPSQFVTEEGSTTKTILLAIYVAGVVIIVCFLIIVIALA